MDRIGLLSDPAQMEKLIGQAIPALARRAETTGGDLASIELTRRFGEISPIMQAKHLQTAMRISEELEKKGMTIADIFKQGAIEPQQIEDTELSLEVRQKL